MAGMIAEGDEELKDELEEDDDDEDEGKIPMFAVAMFCWGWRDDNKAERPRRNSSSGRRRDAVHHCCPEGEGCEKSQIFKIKVKES